MGKKFLVLNEAKTGSAWYRGTGPWSEIARGLEATSEIDIVFGNRFDWCDLRSAIGLMAVRPSNDDELRMIKEMKWFGGKVWLDFDDDILNVPPENPSFAFYARNAVRENIEEALKLADVVTFSTKYLMDRMAKYCPQADCFVVQNAFDEKILYHRKPLQRGAVAPIVMWRGSNTHHKDLIEFERPIVRLAEKHKDLVWVFFGVEPWFSHRIKSKHCITDALSITDFYLNLAAFHSMLGIVPLVDNGFNRCKSNIAAMELATTGGIQVVPGWDEWRDIDGAFNYCDPDDFEEAFDVAKNSDVGEMNARTIQYFRTHLSMKKMNDFRREIFRGWIRA